ncbi:hypothetical protein BUALT_Bualt11G0063800 [Buddleja alternifolia]|uniref:Uncharacterized protein n=1 Tax=Buddleja alternifolia TaxID=168488 RepID=A0AAV6X3M7_9LAMI|nr:hypothetical protein BUALT_Bualt11G0063800 [Buddleja alternifolia]
MALPNGIQSTSELLDAQALVWNHIYNFINSMSLKCAIQLGIPDIIHSHGTPMNLLDLTNALSINKAKSPCVDRLMRILVHSKLFIKEEKGYWLTPASRLLLRNDPFSLAPYALFALDPILTDPCHHLSEWFQNDDPTPFMTTHGTTCWEHTRQNPGMNHIFNEAMASDARLVASLVIKHCKQVFEGLHSMVDVGGGTGTMAKIIGDAFPDMKCIVFELPNVVAGLEGTNNLTFVVGDMFLSIPPADAILMKWILHDWSDDECVEILKKCKEAIPNKDKGGKVIIIDMVVDNYKLKEEQHSATETQLSLDLLMMTLTSGRERSEKDWANLFCIAGFTSYKITPVLGLKSLIEVLP